MTATASPALDDYITTLRVRLGGKDASRLPQQLLGAVSFVFRCEDGRRDRVTLRFAAEGISVQPGTSLRDGEPTAIVMCSLQQWLAFFEQGDASLIDAIDFFGETRLISALTTLASQRTSPLQARLRVP